MEALKQRLSALKANAATDGGADHIAKVQAWKDWKKESGKDLCDLLTWALGSDRRRGRRWSPGSGGNHPG